MLELALREVRPAFPTQAEAIRAGVYGMALADRRAETEPTRDQGWGTGGPEADTRVIQVAAYRDLQTAQHAAATAGRRFPHLAVEVERGGGFFRVVLGGWATPLAAQGTLADVRRHYPDAWLRQRALP